MKKILLLLFTLASVMCYAAQNSATEDSGVVINGIRWATRNVDAPGTFAANPESAGQLFQWNRQQGWVAADAVSGWNSDPASGRDWESANNPCPPGWRVPTQAELQGLLSSGGTWTRQNRVRGTLFGTAPNQLFLPAVGWRAASDGSLHNAGTRGGYWSSTQRGSTTSFALWIRQEESVINHYNRARGFSVRCVVDI